MTGCLIALQLLFLLWLAVVYWIGIWQCLQWNIMMNDAISHWPNPSSYFHFLQCNLLLSLVLPYTVGGIKKKAYIFSKHLLYKFLMLQTNLTLCVGWNHRMKVLCCTLFRSDCIKCLLIRPRWRGDRASRKRQHDGLMLWFAWIIQPLVIQCWTSGQKENRDRVAHPWQQKRSMRERQTDREGEGNRRIISFQIMSNRLTNSPRPKTAHTAIPIETQHPNIHFFGKIWEWAGIIITLTYCFDHCSVIAVIAVLYIMLQC